MVEVVNGGGGQRWKWSTVVVVNGGGCVKHLYVY